MGWSVITTSGTNGTANASSPASPWNALTLSGSLSVGDRLVLVINLNTGNVSPSVDTVTDTAGNTYRKLGAGNQSGGGSLLQTAIFSSSITHAGAPGTLQVAYSGGFTGGFGMGISAQAYSGTQTTNDGTEADVGVASNGTNTSPTTANMGTTANTTAASELVICGYGDWGNNTSLAAGTGFVLRQFDQNGDSQTGIEDKDSSTSGVGQTGGFNSSSNANWAGYIVVIKNSAFTSSTRTATPVTVALSATATRTASPVTVVTSLAGQHAQPVSDQSIGNWTTQAGGTANLWSTVDEVSFDDSDYVQSGQAPASSDHLTLNLGSVSTPQSGSRVLHYRYSKDAGTERTDLQVELLQGVTVVQSWTHTDIPTTWTQADQSVTGTITDYTDLHIRLTATQV